LKLWIGNVAPGTSDEELKAFLARYGVDSIASIQQVEGDGTRPAVIVEVPASTEMLMKVTQRLNGLHWKGRSLTVQAMTR
jgi:hypothetical protein